MMTGLMDGGGRSHRRTPVLLMEGNEGTVASVRDALDELDVSYDVLHVSRAEEALIFLRRNKAANAVVFLLDGVDPGPLRLDILRRLKADDELKSIPVIILASSRDAKAVDESFALGAAGYVVKSPDSQEFTEAMRTIDRYWRLSQAPRGG